MPGYDPDEPCVPLSHLAWPGDGIPLIDPRWRTSEVLGVARGIGGDLGYDRLPILADALEEAGCDNWYVLNHCRRTSPHHPACWVISAVLKEPVVPVPAEKEPVPEVVLPPAKTHGALSELAEKASGSTVRALIWLCVRLLALTALIMLSRVWG